MTIMHRHKLKHPSSQLGVTMIEVVLGLLILGLSLSGITSLTQQQVNKNISAATAVHMRIIADATRDYLRDNFTIVTGVATATVPVKIDVATLAAGGYLEATFNPVNPNSQTVCALALQPSANELDVLVVSTGGTPFSDGDLQDITQVMGPSGGGLYEANPSGPSTNIIGSGDSYNFPRGNYHNAGRDCTSVGNGGVNLIPGHPVLALWFDQSEYASGVLYREAIPGRPELNQMNTDLDLNGFSVNNVDTLTTTGDVTAGNDLSVSGNTSIGNDLIVTFDGLVGNDLTIANDLTVNGDAVIDNDASIAGDLNVTGDGTMDRLTANIAQLNDNFVEGTACSTKEIGTTALGELMSCVSGSWVRAVKAGPGASVSGAYYYNTANLVPRVRWGNWSNSLCTSSGGTYLRVANSSRRRTSQGVDHTYLCLS